MKINETLKSITTQLPENVQLIVVSKTKSVEEIMEVYNAGQRVFGENKTQELVIKANKLPLDIKWHMIGHLQTNKVKSIISFISMIHSIDSLKLAQVINKEASKIDRKIPCLLQVHISREQTKFGFSPDELKQSLESGDLTGFSHLQICGLMGMATFTDDSEIVYSEFRQLSALFHQIQMKFFKDKPWFKELSMGMSGDYKIAIENGTTMVRIGTLIFGQR